MSSSPALIFPIISGDDFVKSGDGTFSAPVKLKLGENMRNVRNYTPTDSQLDGIKTAGGRNYGDGNFYIHSKERGYNFDDFLGDFQGVLQRNRNRDHLGAGGQLDSPPHSPNSSIQSNQNASPPFNAPPGFSDAFPPSSSDSENDSDDPLALTDKEDPFDYLAHALSQLPHRHLTARPKRQVNGNTGNRQWMRDLPRWTNTRSGKLWTANPTCEWLVHAGSTGAKSMATPESLPVTRLDGSQKATHNGKESISMSSMRPSHTKTPSECKAPVTIHLWHNHPLSHVRWQLRKANSSRLRGCQLGR
jgi:hypothetical protein